MPLSYRYIYFGLKSDGILALLGCVLGGSRLFVDLGAMIGRKNCLILVFPSCILVLALCAPSYTNLTEFLYHSLRDLCGRASISSRDFSIISLSWLSSCDFTVYNALTFVCNWWCWVASSGFLVSDWCANWHRRRHISACSLHICVMMVLAHLSPSHFRIRSWHRTHSLDHLPLMIWCHPIACCAFP